MTASDNLPGTDDDSAAGIFRFRASWEAFGRGTDHPGTLMFLFAWPTRHWWGKTLRSNFIVSGVEIDNKDFQPDNAYKRTVRASTNMFWSPTPRLDLAIEYVWGRRTNKNGDADDASQIQLISKYGF